MIRKFLKAANHEYIHLFFRAPNQIHAKITFCNVVQNFAISCFAVYWVTFRCVTKWFATVINQMFFKWKINPQWQREKINSFTISQYEEKEPLLTHYFSSTTQKFLARLKVTNEGNKQRISFSQSCYFL